MKRLLLLAALVLMATSAQAEWIKVSDTGRYSTAYEEGSVKALGRGWFSGNYAVSDRQNDFLYICSTRFTRESYIDDSCVNKAGRSFETSGERKEVIPNSLMEEVVNTMIKSVSY
jgi:hypothetical protein